MKVHVITHGPHQKGEETAEAYDGPLTAEAREQLSKIKLPDFEVAFSGLMKRHQETCETLHVSARKISECGNDWDMFSMIYDFNQLPANLFWHWLNSLKAIGLEEILLITSRGYLQLIPYFLGGGEKKFGSAGAFLNTIVFTATLPGVIIPFQASGTLQTFEI